jgi:predicted acyl esterase
MFRQGHRIRVAVTSSSFPRYDRKPEHRRHIRRRGAGQVTLNTVFHDAARPSRIILPVME